MMRSTTRSFGIPVLLLAVLFAGCRADRSAEAAAPAAEQSPDPWAAMSLEALYGAPAAENLRTVPVEITLRGLPRGWGGFRISAISDFQLGMWEDNERVAVAAIQQAIESGADLIVLLGDYTAPGTDPAILQRVLQPLRGRQAVAVLGNQDVRTDSVEARTVQALQAHGVTVLRNEALPIVRGNDTAYIAGLSADFALLPAWQQAEILNGISAAGFPALLLAHSPDVAARLPERRFPAVVAGGTFCGQTEVPGTPRLAAVLGETLPGAQVVGGSQRVFRVRGNSLFVTCGIGYTFVPMRFGAPPEIVLLTLVRMPEQTAAPADTVLPDPDTEPAEPDPLPAQEPM